jgi:hypothetical protein
MAALTSMQKNYLRHALANGATADDVITTLDSVGSVTACTVTASKAVVVDSNKDISAFRNITFAGALIASGATGTCELQLVTNLADAFSLEDSAGDLIVVDTSTGAQVITITPALTVTGAITANGGITLNAGDNIVCATSTGTKIGTGTNQLIGFYNATPVDQPAALTAQLTSITHTAPGSPDYALQDLVQNTGFGFATADEGNTLLSVVLNLQVRCAQVEARLEELGLVAAN